MWVGDEFRISAILQPRIFPNDLSVCCVASAIESTDNLQFLDGTFKHESFDACAQNMLNFYTLHFLELISILRDRIACTYGNSQLDDFLEQHSPADQDQHNSSSPPNITEPSADQVVRIAAESD